MQWRTIRVMFNIVRKGHDMKPWIKKAAAGALGAIVLAGGLTACSTSHTRTAQSAERMAEFKGKAVLRISSKLDLNDDQKAKLNVLADKLDAQRVQLTGSGAGARAELAGLLASERFDRVKAQSLLDEKTRAVQTTGPEVIQAMGDFYDSLQPAQQQKVRERLQGHGRWFDRG